MRKITHIRRALLFTAKRWTATSFSPNTLLHFMTDFPQEFAYVRMYITKLLS